MTTKVSIGLGGTGSNSAASTLTSIGAVAKSGDTMTGALLLAAGSNTAPAISRSTDTDTGIYFPAANEMAITTGGTVAQAFNSNGVFFRNRIINGDMRIAQRGTAAVTTSQAFPVDRFRVPNGTDGAFSAQQDSSAPTGFINSLKYTVTTADTNLTTTQNTNVTQVIEGTNIADLMWGTASARTVTLSFWVRSSLTGTFGGGLRNGTSTRSYPFTYSISAVDTWEYKTVTIPGDTSGTWTTGAVEGLGISFSLGAGPDATGTPSAWNSNNNPAATGQTQLISTLNATWYITGVQLETGSVATPFERRPYGTELMLCQRYFTRFNGTALDKPWCNAAVFDSTSAYGVIPLPVTMRSDPTISFSGTNALRLLAAGAGFTAGSSNAGSATPQALEVYGNYTGLTQGQAGWMRAPAANSWIAASAEL